MARTIDADGRECDQFTQAGGGWASAFRGDSPDAIENGSGSCVGNPVVQKEFVRMDQEERRHGDEKEHLEYVKCR